MPILELLRQLSRTGFPILLGAIALFNFGGCRSYSTIETPTTDGFHAKLPAPYTRAVVWGGRPDTVQSVSTWLLKKGILVVDQAKVLQAAADQKVSLSGYQYLETDVLRMAKLFGARLVVFANAEVGSWEVVGWDSGLPHNQRVYAASISLRAVDVNTGEIEWSGKAQATDRFGNLEDGISVLACHALATAWGLRNPGSNAPEHLCVSGSGVMSHDAAAPRATPPANTSSSSSQSQSNPTTY